MKRIAAVVCLLLSIPAFAQTTTTYVGTIKDLTGAAVTSGRVTWTLSVKIATLPGTGAFTSTTVSCNINGSGTPVNAQGGACTITNNTALTPTGTYYTMCIQPGNITPGSCIATYATGGTVDISTLVPTPTTQPNYGVTSTGCPLTGCTMTGALINSATVQAPNLPIDICSESGSTFGDKVRAANTAAIAAGGGVIDSACINGTTTNTTGSLPIEIGSPTVRVIWKLPSTGRLNVTQSGNNLPTPAATSATFTSAGSGFPSGTVYLKIAYRSGGGVSAASSEFTCTLTGTGYCTIASPPSVSYSYSYNVYASSTSGAETWQANCLIGQSCSIAKNFPNTYLVGFESAPTSATGVPAIIVHGASGSGITSDAAGTGFNLQMASTANVSNEIATEDEFGQPTIKNVLLGANNSTPGTITDSLILVQSAFNQSQIDGIYAFCNYGSVPGMKMILADDMTVGKIYIDGVGSNPCTPLMKLDNRQIFSDTSDFLGSLSFSGLLLANPPTNGTILQINGGINGTAAAGFARNISCTGCSLENNRSATGVTFASISNTRGLLFNGPSFNGSISAETLLSFSESTACSTQDLTINNASIPSQGETFISDGITPETIPSPAGSFSTNRYSYHIGASVTDACPNNPTTYVRGTLPNYDAYSAPIGSVNSASANQLAYYASTGQIVSGTNALPNGTTAVTQSPGDNTTKVATDAYVLANAGTSAVTQIVAGTNVTISPVGGTGAVTINATSGSAAFPGTNGVVYNTSTTASRNATAADIGGLFPCSSGSPYVTNISGTPGCSSSSTTTQRGIDAVGAGGLNSASSDNTSTWLSLLSTNCASTACEIYIPCGQYKIATNDKVPVTSGTYQGVKIIGEAKGTFQGHNCVEFDVMTPGIWGLWWDNTTVGSGNNGGPDIENITFVDKTTQSQCNSTYGSNAIANHPSWLNVSGNPVGCAAGALRVTQTNYGTLKSIGAQYFEGILDWNGANNGAGTGNITVTNGSQTATCGSCSFASAMNQGFLWVNGEMQEICSVSGSTATLCSNWEYPTYTGTNWNVDYNGVQYMFDDVLSGCTSSSDCFSQYWTIEDVYGWGSRVGFDFAGDPTSACWAGESRFRIFGNAMRGEHIPDSVGIFMGKCVDTIHYNIAQNDYAFHAVIENGHANFIDGAEFENAGADASHAAIYTCNSGTPVQSCTKGVVLNCETAGECHDNTVLGGYIYDTGNPIELNNDTVVSGDYFAFVRMRSNTASGIVWKSGATCSTQTSATVYTSGCQKGN